MDRAGDSVTLAYRGWSGFELTMPSAGPPLIIDPPDAELLPRDQEVRLLISHGHPEHIAGARNHVGDEGRTAPVSVIASARVCRYLKRRSRVPADRFHPVAEGDVLTWPGTRIEVFGWRHMPLLPPELGGALSHMGTLLRHPRVTM
ncbi:MAG: hypothetical protein CMJ83_08005, partial [Planctomycetes bacterium]|nr:hypothetical protein [Planctomycetota bacterium]